MLTTDNSCAATLLLPTDRGMKVIPVATIVRVEAISNYSKLYFSDGRTLVVARVLRRFVECLSPNQFVRIHHKHLVNMQWLHVYTSDALQTVLSTGEVLPVSRRKEKAAKTAVMRWQQNQVAT